MDWDRLKQIVDTAGRPCPHLLGERCPGTRAECAFWMEETVESEGRLRVLGGCLFAFTYVQQHESVMESIRTQAGIDKAATVLRQAGIAVTGALVNGGPLGLGR